MGLKQSLKVTLVTDEFLSVCATSAPLLCLFSNRNTIVTYNRAHLTLMSIVELVTIGARRPQRQTILIESSHPLSFFISLMLLSIF